MVVDGTNEFVGSNPRSANEAFLKAVNAPKRPIRISSITQERTNILRAHVETESLPASLDSGEVEVYLAVALNSAESHVSRGENGERMLAHTAVVRNLVKIGSLRKGQIFAQDVQLKVESGADSHNLRLIAFLQEPRQGRVVGATVELVGAR